MAELVLKTEALVNPKFDNGDPIDAFNKDRIECCHAEHICHVKNMTRNSDGLIVPDCLLEDFKKNAYQYKFQRISYDMIKRIDLATLEEVTINGTPMDVDGKMQHMDVPRFIRKRKKHPLNAIFGVKGAEYWYGGKRNVQVSTIWDAIEGNTANRRTDKPHWPLMPNELTLFLAIEIDDFTAPEGEDYKAPLLDVSDPENPIRLKERKHNIAYEAILSLPGATIDQIKDPSKSVDIRDSFNFTRASILTVKTK